MVKAFAVLLLCQLLGEGIAHASGLPVPGPVLGLVLLAGGLVWVGRGARASGPEPARETELAQETESAQEPALARAANGLLSHLSLLFVPAAVGVVQQGPVLAANGVAIGVAVVLSTLLTLAVTAGVFVWALRFAGPAGRP